jgi:electron transport complex protein RnfG
VGLVCALLIVVVYQTTAPTIARNQAEALERAIFQVLPETVSTKTFRREGDTFVPIQQGDLQEGPRIHAGYRDDGTLVGVAIEASGMGYQDTIRTLYGYSLEKDAIVGFRVLESRETPGLGDRIESDEHFLANFERLDVQLNDQGTAPRNGIVAVAQGSKTEPWQVDGLSGATISSVAVANLLRSSTETWIAAVEGNERVFVGEAP